MSIARNVDRTVVDHNRILAGNHYGVFVCTATPPDQCDDTKIIGNLFDGAMEEDQIRANVYHDADGDGVGLLVEGNEFRGNTERGGHNDVFQSVWVGDHLVFNRNYLHDFGGQGFFVKDQSLAINGFVANNNLIVDQDRPCEPSTLCTGYQLSPWQIYGPISNGEMRNNTVGWGAGGGGAVLTGTYTNIDFSNNVFDTPRDHQRRRQRAVPDRLQQHLLQQQQLVGAGGDDQGLRARLPRPGGRRLPAGQRPRRQLGALRAALRALRGRGRSGRGRHGLVEHGEHRLAIELAVGVERKLG